MEVCVPCNTSAGQDVISTCGSSTDPVNPTHCSSKDLSQVELETRLTQYLNIEDIELSNCGSYLSPTKNDIVDVVRDDGREKKTKTTSSASQQCFSKCSTFPPLGEPKTVEVCDVNGCAKSVNQCHSQPMSLPTSLKVVSAMKGSREKRGIAPKKLSVTWSPDVYDPTPTSVSHVPSNKNQHYRSSGKKYGKSKQKSIAKSAKSSRGKSKDKKQPRKNSGSTNKIKPIHDRGGIMGILDFDLQTQTHFAEVVF